MRKLKLQVQISVDGFVAGPNGEMDWMTWNWDNPLKDYVTRLHETVDTILLGRKMTAGFISHWVDVLAKPDDPSYELARKMIDTPKVVFSRTLQQSEWPNTTVTGDLRAQVDKLKNQNGGDIIVYGGAGLNTSLIQEGLIDEFHLFVNPAAIGSGLTIFAGLNAIQQLKLLNATAFDCGIVVLHYTL